jgi:chromosome segregation protein
MHLKKLELQGFKSFAHKSEFVFDVPIIAIVGPNGSGKSNVVEAIRFVLGEQSVKSMRGKTGSDLIFKGSQDIKKKSRARVAITFDNKQRVFSLGQDDNSSISVDFDEVEISREVFTDGSSNYAINGTAVRMKDVHELIASINIGSSGHHIISQGEADRYLNANAKDRRSLIEEALGLRVYQYRIKESLRKLERAQENIRETELLRREIAPHLRFLKRQVDKIEQAKEIRLQLRTDYREYLLKEDIMISQKLLELQQEEAQHAQKLAKIEQALEAYTDNEGQQETQETVALRGKQEEYQTKDQQRQKETQELRRVEGMIAVLEQPQKTLPKKIVSFTKAQSIISTITSLIDSVNVHDAQSIKEVFAGIRKHLTELIEGNDTPEDNQSQRLDELKQQQLVLTQAIETYEKELATIEGEIQQLRNTVEHLQEQKHQQQKEYYEFLAQQRELKAQSQLLESKRTSLEHRQEDRDMHKREALALLNEDSISYEDDDHIDPNDINQEAQVQLLRSIERAKIRLEDIGGGSGSDVIKEYQETQERDEFLKHEIEDVSTTIASLHELISGLKDNLNQEFTVGMKKINHEFNRFFGLMFGGGEAALKEVPITTRKNGDEEQDDEKEFGIDISVRLPRKKVSDLDMLSGGERSLTSIALLFALSQVNPPPFLVLDETDAALDEANSQKYGDMVESLSEYSQLILVTHNRETMSRAQTLFGITLGRDDASTMLSLRLEDAQQYAK